MNQKKPKNQHMQFLTFTQAPAAAGNQCVVVNGRGAATAVAAGAPESNLQMILARQLAKKKERRLAVLTQESIFRRKLSF